MTRERIEDMREVVLPFVKKRLLETNYEGLGESDAEMFAKDFDEILDLANKALEQESIFEKINKIEKGKGFALARVGRKFRQIAALEADNIDTAFGGALEGMGPAL